MVNQYLCVIVAVCCSCSFLPQQVSAQSRLMRNEESNSTLASPTRSGRNRPLLLIESVPVDPFMSLEEEQKITAELMATSTEPWEGLTIRQLSIELSEKFKVWIVDSELDLLGIDADSTLESRICSGPLGARLEAALHPFELSYLITANRLEITSRDDCESRSPTRIYDVSRLSGSALEMRELINTVCSSIAPDSWIQSGGCCTIVPKLKRTTQGSVRETLVITAPTATQLRVASLFERLALIGDPQLGKNVFGQSARASKQVTYPFAKENR